MSVTICLTYKREWEATIPELWAIAHEKKIETGMPGGRALREGEQRDPFPDWLACVLTRRGYVYEWFNARYIKKVDGANEDLINKRIEDERLWLVRLLDIVRDHRWQSRFWKTLRLQARSIFLLTMPDKTLAPLPAPPATVAAVVLTEGVVYRSRDGKKCTPTGKRPEQKVEGEAPLIWWQYDHEGETWNHCPKNGCISWAGKHPSPHDIVAKWDAPPAQAPVMPNVFLKAAQLARVTPVFVDGLDFQHDDMQAEDTRVEEKNF